MTLSPAFLDELRARTQLSALIGRTTKLQRAGREWKAPCPFHNEKTPSFYVNDDKGFYHCFGCSAHGDAIRWLTDQRGLPFMDAVKELAQSAGMELPAPDPRAAERQERAVGLHEACAAAQAWFVEQLGGIEAAETRAYLSKRGIGAAAIRDFGLGFAPDARGKLRAALKQFGDDLLVEAGLLIKVEEKDPYDRFRGRLMIPIRDQRGRVIAFGGRIIGDGEPKYLNSPETPLFDKGRTLYNLDKAAPAARTANRLIVVEGYLDVIALAQAGIAEAVAPLGTALTEQQLERLWRVVPVPLLCFDGDSAGQKAAIRVIARALPQLGAERSLGFVNLPAGQDPDDIVRAGGRAAIDALLDAPEPLVERLWRHELAAQPLDTPEGRAGLKQRVVEQARAIEDRDVRDQYLADLRRRFDALYAEAPRRFVPGQNRLNFDRRSSGPPRAPSSVSRGISSIGIDPTLGREILAGLLRHPAMLADCVDTLSLLAIGDPELERLRRFLLDRALLGNPLEAANLRTILDEAGLGALVADLLKANRMRFSFARAKSGPAVALRDLKLALEAIASEVELDAAIADVTSKLAEASDDSYFREQLRLTAARKDARDRLAALAERDGEAATQERQAELNGEDERRR